MTLLVNPANGDGAVQAVYEAWGYRKIGDQQPFPDSPVFSVMLRPVKQDWGLSSQIIGWWSMVE
ncbi:hypothetical protein GCM10010095_83220 [Streptomyces anthocyanicus]|uniref:hypothetical protein n=1 Tax=Streptomyces TaxID=1883 RepID=UPI00166FE9C9|nr:MULTISPECIES: hypothetical protein [Streptomyces]GGL85754.1 hypothetical protein GCM10010095_83220 [Streptomyces anthocyanicus]